MIFPNGIMQCRHDADSDYDSEQTPSVEKSENSEFLVKLSSKHTKCPAHNNGSGQKSAMEQDLLHMYVRLS